MSTTIFSKSYAAGAKRKARRRAVVISTAVAVALAGGGAALAAMLLSSNTAEAKLDKGAAQQLVLSAAQFTGGPLFPGTSVGLTFSVKNPNAFPATVSKVVLDGTSSTTCDLAQLTGPAADVGTVDNLTLTLASPVQLAAGEEKAVTFPKVVTLKSAATDSCAITAKFQVTGTGAGSGN